MRQAKDRIIIALDYDNEQQALDTVSKLGNKTGMFKIGSQLFTACGPEIVARTRAFGGDVFLDLKFHDIPNTVSGAVAAAAAQGVKMLTMHAAGGRAMMERAAETAAKARHKPLLIAITVLTSMDKASMEEIGIKAEIKDTALSLARLAKDCGLDGVVCSPEEAALLRRELGESFLLVTPGIRPAAADNNDQKRVATPAEAMRNGADYLVIGRAVTSASNPVAACDAIIREIEQI